MPAAISVSRFKLNGYQFLPIRTLLSFAARVALFMLAAR
jgi:hypothetical protein